MSRTRVIAFYLPQFYPTPENDEWWEPGFTEWTNVARAKSLFRGHYQPRIPRDLGFYDLRVPETRERQKELAQMAGIEGFCYWHYWFAGRKLLNRIFDEVVESGNPDFPFCLCWANHSWYKKTWSPGSSDRLLIKQTYPGEQDCIAHFYDLLPAFRDRRYMKIDGKLIFGIFNSDSIQSFSLLKQVWNELARENDLEGFYFWGLVQSENRLNRALNNSYDALVYENMSNVYNLHWPLWKSRLWHLFHQPKTLSYRKYVDASISFFRQHDEFIPCIVPNFDHSPRSSFYGIILKDNNPKEWGRLCREVEQMQQERHSPVVFIKAWNEWGEGNYLEPDEKYGYAYIDECRRAFLGNRL